MVTKNSLIQGAFLQLDFGNGTAENTFDGQNFVFEFYGFLL